MIIYTNKKAARQAMNQLGKARTPFLFLVDYEMKKIIISTNFEQSDDILFNINGGKNEVQKPKLKSNFTFDRIPMSKSEYGKGFDQVMHEIQIGNSFLLNLTYPTELKTNLSLDDIFFMTDAKYKIRLKNEFVCYSPEIFIKIENRRISSYPMKGTIDAKIEDAEKIILNDSKEVAEHYTIVDLIRNDLSRVAKKVKVEKFRYIDTIKTTDKDLLQVSSEVAGQLPKNYHENLGSILFRLLPAGSISGAPKAKTVEVVRKAEGQDRGYYSGICGIYDGKNLDSGVMIRFIEKNEEKKFYRSGCGITSLSQSDNEYKEMIDKVYLPLSNTKNNN